jgi:hypothetical protein
MTTSNVCVEEACRLRWIRRGRRPQLLQVAAGAVPGCGEGAVSAAASLSLLAASAREESRQRDETGEDCASACATLACGDQNSARAFVTDGLMPGWG